MRHNRFIRDTCVGSHVPVDLLFTPHCRLDSFPAFCYSTRRSGPGDIHELSSAYRLYLFLGELKNRR